MSGIEVAGLVMAAFPLLISGIQFYIDGCDTIERWRKWESVLAHLARNIKAEHRIFRNVCKRLELEIILDSHRSREITDAQIDALQRRLGDSYDDFVAVARDLAKILVKCRKKLDLDKVGNVGRAPEYVQNKSLTINKPKWLEASSARREWSKIKLSFSEKVFDKLLERIEKNNKTLRYMLKDSGIIGDLSLNCKTSSRGGEGYGTVRAYARSLYYILDQSLSSTCSCSNSHDTNLRLETRWNKQRLEAAAAEQEAISFTLMFLLGKPNTEAEEELWNWRKAVVEPLKQKDSFTHPQQSHILQNPSTGSRLSALDQPSDVSATLAFSLGTLMATGSSTMNRHVSASEIATRSHGDRLSMKNNKSESDLIPLEKISNLCEAIRTIQDEKSCLGVLVDESDHQHRISTIKSLHSTERITLKALLENKNATLTSRDRLILGTKLAATLLQFYQTPWLGEHWGRKDIHFVKSNETPSAYFQEPFITRSFVPNGGSQATVDASTVVGRQPSKRRSPLSVRVPSLFSLGILLIELSYCKPFEALGPGANLPGACDASIISGMCEDDVKFCVALRLLEPHNEQGLNYAWTGLRYANAVRRCIRCDLDVSEGEYDSDAFHAAVYRGVMDPLMQTLKSHCGENEEIVNNLLS